ncbi:MAG: outer membrane beta-barrel protein [Bacteroidota bacterium]|nr:outer membrane beta-barrel protein [Bacteroidota bacterium]
MKRIKILIAISALLVSLNSFGQEFYTNMTYDMSVPVGSTSDFISKTSFRGFTFNLGRFVTNEIAIDLRFSWNTFYEARDFETYTIGDGTTSLTGKQFRYINSFPLTAGARYVMNPSSTFSPYFAAGLGAYKINERVDMGIYYNEDRIWHFGFYPEIGLFYDFAYNVGLNIYARYDYALKTKDASSYSYIAFGVGFHFKN